MSVGHEILEAVGRQHLLDAGPHPPVAAAVAAGRRGPLVPRPIGAFRQPDTAGGTPEVAPVRLDRGAQLQVDRLVSPQEWQITVRCRAGDDLYVAAPLEIGKGARDVAPNPAVHLPHPLEEFLPEVGQAYDFLLALAREVLAGFGARAPGVVMVKR